MSRAGSCRSAALATLAPPNGTFLSCRDNSRTSKRVTKVQLDCHGRSEVTGALNACLALTRSSNTSITTNLILSRLDRARQGQVRVGSRVASPQRGKIPPSAGMQIITPMLPRPPGCDSQTVLPPGGHGTTTRTGRYGQVCAAARPPSDAAITAYVLGILTVC